MERKQSRLTVVYWLGFTLYIIALSYFMFFSESYGRTEGTGEYHYNLTLFKEIKRFWDNREVIGWQAFTVNIVGNVLAFAPFGFLLPMLFPRLGRFFKILLYTLFFSLVMELLQLAFKLGCFDVDDLFLNTIGGIVGYLCYLPVKQYRKKVRHKRIYKNRPRAVRSSRPERNSNAGVQ